MAKKTTGYGKFFKGKTPKGSTGSPLPKGMKKKSTTHTPTTTIYHDDTTDNRTTWYRDDGAGKLPDTFGDEK
jgi:hypothetical protein